MGTNNSVLKNPARANPMAKPILAVELCDKTVKPLDKEMSAGDGPQKDAAIRGWRDRVTHRGTFADQFHGRKNEAQGESRHCAHPPRTVLRD